MVLVILLFSLAGKPNVGLIIYVTILMAAVTLILGVFAKLFRTIIPTNYATLSNIGAAFPNRELKSVPIVLTLICRCRCSADRRDGHHRQKHGLALHQERISII